MGLDLSDSRLLSGAREIVVMTLRWSRLQPQEHEQMGKSANRMPNHSRDLDPFCKMW